MKRVGIVERVNKTDVSELFINAFALLISVFDIEIGDVIRQYGDFVGV